MAELNISGFVTPEQQFAGLYKLADTLENQRSLAEKAKKALPKLDYTIDPSKFHTGTIEDPHISADIYDALGLAQKWIKDNPGGSQNDLDMYMNPIVSKIYAASQAAIIKKDAADKAWSELSKNPSADKNKFYAAIDQSVFKNPDGTLKDASTIDVTRHDDIDNVMQTGDIWNSGGFYRLMDDFNKNSKQATGVTIVKTKGKDIITSSADIEHSDLYEPVQTGTDANGVPVYSDEFRQRGEKSVKLPKIDQSGNVVIDPSTNQPILEDKKIIGDDVWKRLTTDEKTAGWVNGLLKEYASKHNVDKDSDEAINAVKSQMHEMIDASGQKNKVNVLFSTKRHFSTPRSGGGSGTSGGGQMRDYNKLIHEAYDDAIATYGKGYNPKISDLESDLQTAIITALKGAGISKARADKYRLQLDANGILRVVDNNTLQDVLPITDALNTVKQITSGGKKLAVDKANKNPTPGTQGKHGVTGTPKSKGKGKFDNF